MSDLTTKLKKEARRIEEDCTYSSKGHYNAAEKSGRRHLIVSVLAASFAAAASGFAFNNIPWLAGILAIISTSLTAVLTLLKHSECAENHKAVAGQYLALKNQTRMFREIDLEETGFSDTTKRRLSELADKRDELNQASPTINREHYELAKTDIVAGFSKHQTDKEEL